MILEELGGVLSQNMTTFSKYFLTWRLKLSHSKAVTIAFQLSNRNAKRQLAIYNNNNLLPFCTVPSYLGDKLDRSLTFLHHIEAKNKTLPKKLKSGVALLRQLAGSRWGADAKTLEIAAPSLMYSTFEYCAPICCRNAYTRLIGSVLNDAMCIANRCLCSTRTDCLPIPVGIQPAERCRQGATLPGIPQSDETQTPTLSVNGSVHYLMVCP